MLFSLKLYVTSVSQKITKVEKCNMRPNMKFCSRKEGKKEEFCKKRGNFDFPACQNSLAMAASSEVQSKLIHHAKWNTETVDTSHVFQGGNEQLQTD